MKIFVSVSSEISSILVTSFWGNKWCNTGKTFFCQSVPEKLTRKKEKKKKKKGLLKNFLRYKQTQKRKFHVFS